MQLLWIVFVLGISGSVSASEKSSFVKTLKYTSPRNDDPSCFIDYDSKKISEKSLKAFIQVSQADWKDEGARLKDCDPAKDSRYKNCEQHEWPNEVFLANAAVSMDLRKKRLASFKAKSQDIPKSTAVSQLRKDLIALYEADVEIIRRQIEYLKTDSVAVLEEKYKGHDIKGKCESGIEELTSLDQDDRKSVRIIDVLRLSYEYCFRDVFELPVEKIIESKALPNFCYQNRCDCTGEP